MFNQPMYYGQQPYQVNSMYQQPMVKQQATPIKQDVIVRVSNATEARNAEIPMDSSVSYFVFGNSILAKNWNFATGKIEHKLYTLVENAEPIEESKSDKLSIIEEKLDTLLAQINNQKMQPKKKEVKDAE